MIFSRALFFLLVLARVGSVSAQDRAIVMIDAGHGGEEVGVTTEDVLEKDMVLRVGFVLAEELVSRGYDVRLTRTGDYDVPWPERREMAETAGASLLIMLHMNGDEDVSKHGIEIYANVEDPVANHAAETMAASLRMLDTPVVVENRPWPFLQSPTVPTVMVEAGFLTHPVERRLLKSPEYHRKLAARLADGAVKGIQARR